VKERLSTRSMVVRMLMMTAMVACGIFSAGQAVAAGTAVGSPPARFHLQVQAAAVYPGEVVRVGLEGTALRKAGDQTGEGIVVGELQVAGRKFPVIAEGAGHVAYIGFDLDTKPGKKSVSFSVGPFHGSAAVVVEKKTFGRESLKVKPSFTDLDKATLARVARESKRLHKLWMVVTPKKLWTEAFRKPTAGAFGSPFGLRRIFNGKPRSPHSGLDIRSPMGTPIHASNRGRVVEASNLFFTGNTVVIDHGLGLYTLYAHMSRIDVKPGQDVGRGQVIGLVGATGRVTGPHLHWGAKLVGARVDPVSLLGL